MKYAPSFILVCIAATHVQARDHLRNRHSPSHHSRNVHSRGDVYTWPSPRYDAIEEIMYEQEGYRGREFRNKVTPCSTSQGEADDRKRSVKKRSSGGCPLGHTSSSTPSVKRHGHKSHLTAGPSQRAHNRRQDDDEEETEDPEEDEDDEGGEVEEPEEPSTFDPVDVPGTNAADWLRIGFHDMGTHNAAAGTGGLDASVIFETSRPENHGLSNITFGFIFEFLSSRTSFADLIAVAAYAGVRGCGGPELSIRTGRVDAKVADATGLPNPDDPIETIEGKFARAGFNQRDMIEMVACGHTLGGVHGADFPEIVAYVTGMASTQIALFDRTDTFDTMVATTYLDGTTRNPLVIGPAATNSDARIFASDGNVTMKALADTATFFTRCKSIIERMLDTVPNSVTLGPPIVAPIEVKPVAIRMDLAADGSLIFKGHIRVLMTGRTGRTINSVVVSYTPRSGSACADCTVTATLAGTGNGLDHQFNWYEFSRTINPLVGVSRFSVAITSAEAGSETYTNGKSLGFPVQDRVMVLRSKSCLSPFNVDANGNYNFTVVAAVHESRLADPIVLKVIERTPRPTARIKAPTLNERLVPMERWNDGVDAGGFTLFKGTFAMLSDSWSTTFDVSAGVGYVDGYHRTNGLPSFCR